MNEFEHLSREQLIQLLLAFREQIGVLSRRIAELEGGGGPPEAGSTMPDGGSPVVPAWVKANRPASSPKPRKKRAFACVRRRQPPTRVVEHRPEHCPDCGRDLPEGTLQRTREVIDLPEAPVEVVEHRFYACYCGVCHKRVIASPDLSDQVLGKSRIGIRLMSLIAYLDTEARLPVRTIRDFLAAHHGVTLSIGEICDILHRVAQRGKPVCEEFLQRIRSSAVVHADETGSRENGRNGFLWVFANAAVRCYFRDPSRSGRVVEMVLGEGFRGRLVTDFYCAYNIYLGEHQRCWVHLLRDMHELRKKHPENMSVRSFVDAVRGVFEAARAFTHSDPRERRRRRFEFQEELGRIARPFLKQPVPQRTLAERIERFSSELFVFVEHPDTPPDNNAAERAIRPAVIARKVSGGTRSPHGSNTMAVLRSLFATWRLRGHDPLDCCRQLLTGTLSLDGNPAR